MEKQITEIARVLCDAHEPCKKCVWSRCNFGNMATRLYNAGYRKQAEGHWITHADSYECSECGEEIEVDNPEDYDPVSDYDFRFCYHCGAKMKGAENAESD